MKPLFSVIVPVYNAERTISKTIESILCQNFNDFELILVNDGSKDNSLNICLSYASKDQRIKVLDYPNGGVACARNRGLSQAKGDRICFVDADDLVLPDWLLNYSLNIDFDLMIMGHIAISDTGKMEIAEDDGTFVEDKFIKGIEMVSKTGRLNMPWNKCYKRSIIKDNNLEFLLGCDLFEDLIFTLQYIQVAKSLRLISYCGYEYLQFNSVLTRKYNEPEKFLSWINIIMDETLAITKTYIGTSLINHVYGRLFNAATWYVVLFYDRLNYCQRNKVYRFLNSYKMYLDNSEVPKNRTLFRYVSTANQFLDILIGIEAKVYSWVNKN